MSVPACGSNLAETSPQKFFMVISEMVKLAWTYMAESALNVRVSKKEKEGFGGH